MQTNVVAAHQSFRDPVGLARRMAFAPVPAARSALLRTALGVAAIPLDRWLARRERGLVAAAPASHQPLLLIVGAPRSGTTLVYQTLARALPVSYPTNLSALFPHAPITAQAAFSRRHVDPNPRIETRAVPRSFYGQTRGFANTNDAFHVWDRWLGGERYRAPDSLPPETVAAMRQFFDAWRSRFPDPFINKNNRNTDCIDLLAVALPEARFLVVRRDRAATERSLLVARQVVQGDVRRAWGLRSRDADHGEDPLEVVREQLDVIEARLRTQCATVAPERLGEIDFAEFVAEPRGTVEVAARLLELEPRTRP